MKKRETYDIQYWIYCGLNVHNSRASQKETLWYEGGIKIPTKVGFVNAERKENYWHLNMNYYGFNLHNLKASHQGHG